MVGATARPASQRGTATAWAPPPDRLGRRPGPATAAASRDRTHHRTRPGRGLGAADRRRAGHAERPRADTGAATGHRRRRACYRGPPRRRRRSSPMARAGSCSAISRAVRTAWRARVRVPARQLWPAPDERSPAAAHPRRGRAQDRRRHQLWRQASMAGAVRDEAGDPVVGVQVTLLRSMVSLGRRQLVPAQSATTDDRGMYRIGGLSPGNYTSSSANTTSSVPMTTVEEYMRPTSRPGRADRAQRIDARAVDGGRADWRRRAFRSAISNCSSRDSSAVTLVGPLPGAGTRMMVYPTTFYPSANTPSQAMNITLATGEERAGGRSAVEALAVVHASRASCRDRTARWPTCRSSCSRAASTRW